MSPEREDRLLGEIRAARPVAEPTAERWAKSDRAQQVLGDVVAKADDVTSTASTAIRRRKLLLVAASVAGLVVLGVVGIVVASTYTGSSAVVQVVSTTVSGPDTTQDSVLVSESQAVQHIALLSLSWAEHMGEQTGALDLGEAELLSAAVEMDLITLAEATAGSLKEQITEGQYVVLLWKVFGSLVSSTDAPGTVDKIDPADEVAVAVEGLERAGVIRDSDGSFDPERLLSTEREQLLLERMGSALRGETSL